MGDTTQQVAHARLATFTVVGQISDDIAVQVTFLQEWTLQGKDAFLEQLLVSGLRRIEFHDRHVAGLLAADDAQHGGSVLAQLRIVFLVEDTLLVEAVQAVGDDELVVVGQVGQSILKIMVEAFDHLFFYLLVEHIVGLVKLHGTVTLLLDGGL